MKHLRQIGIILFSAIMTILIIELAIPLFVPINYLAVEYDKEYYLTYRKNFEQVKSYQDHKVYLRFNSEGFRDIERPLEKKQDGKTVLLLGDSITANTAAAEKNMYSQVMETRLASLLDQNISVINRGVEGWSPDIEFLYLTKKGYRYEPDAVVLQFTMTNDFSEVEMNNLTYITGKGISVKQSFQPSNYEKLSIFLRQHSGIYNLITGIIRKSRQAQAIPHFFVEGYDMEFQHTFVLTTAIIKEMDAFCKERNIAFAVLIYPDARQVNSQYYEHWNSKSRAYLPQKDMLNVTTALRDFLAENEIVFFDATEKINETWYWVSMEDGHLSEEGSKIFGDYVASNVATLLN